MLFFFGLIQQKKMSTTTNAQVVSSRLNDLYQNLEETTREKKFLSFQRGNIEKKFVFSYSLDVVR